MLLEKKANINAQSSKYNNILQAISQKDYKKLVQMLLKKGIDINAQGGKYNNIF